MPRIGTMAAERLWTSGVDQLKFPEAHVTKGMTGVMHIASSEDLIGHFMATQADTANDAEFRGHTVRTLGDDLFLMVMIMWELRDTEGNVARQCDCRQLLNGGGASTPLALAERAAIKVTSTKMVILDCRAARPQSPRFRLSPRGLCRGNGGHHGSISRTSTTAPVSATSMRPSTSRTSRVPIMLRTIMGQMATEMVRMRTPLLGMRWAEHREAMIKVLCGVMALRAACTLVSLSRITGESEKLPTKFVGGQLRLGGDLAHLQL